MVANRKLAVMSRSVVITKPVLLKKKTVRDLGSKISRESLVKLVEQLYDIDERDHRLELIKSGKVLDEKMSAFADAIHEMESQHKSIVRHMMQKLDVGNGPKGPHDYSKDELYELVMGMNFDCGQSWDDIPSFKELFTEETERHYTLEPHHPEYEALTGNECKERDIKEMAIDRLCRNLQFGDTGTVDVECVMDKYTPKFTLDGERKVAMFKEFVMAYHHIVEKGFVDCFDFTTA